VNSKREIDGKEGMLHSLDLLRDTYNYNHWIYSVMRPYIGERVVEVGSGPGNLTRFLLSSKRLVCIEPDHDFVGHLADLCNAHRNVSVFHKFLDEISLGEQEGYPFDTVLSANVLEHIPDDRAALDQMARLLRPGGYLITFVPAMPWAYGAMDEQLGHCRRYTKHSLGQLFESINLKVERLGYFNFLGAFGWWWAGRIKKERFIDPAKARLMDQMVPYLSALERLVPPLLGQSVLGVAVKK
jgi:phospholipid N-methyltransferase